MTTPPSYQPDPNHQYAPSDTQAISVGDPRLNGNGMAPGQHPKVKQLLNLTLGSAAAFILCKHSFYGTEQHQIVGNGILSGFLWGRRGRNTYSCRPLLFGL